MNYKEKDYKEIFLKELNNALTNGLISHQSEFEKYIKNKQDISNFYVMILSVVAEAIDEVYDDITLEYISTKVRSAEGIDLEDLGVLINCYRPEATKCNVELTFTLSHAHEEDITYEAGLSVFGRTTGYEYVTLEEVYFPAGEVVATVQAEAAIAGVKYNVVENELTRLPNGYSGLTVNNTTPSTGGSEAFTDEEYRYVIKNWILANQRGNEKAFIDFLTRFDGLDGYKLVPNWDGSGTLKVILDPGTAEQLKTCYDGFRSDVCQIDDDIYMTSSAKIGIDVYATVDVDIDVVNPYSASEKEDIKARIISAVKLFIDGGGYRRDGSYYKGLVIGEDFIPHKLAAFLDSEIPELKNISFTYPTEIITITDEEVGTANVISIEMV